jgi:hypothetical protein
VQITKKKHLGEIWAKKVSYLVSRETLSSAINSIYSNQYF